MGQDLEQVQERSAEIRTQMQWAKLAAEGDIIPKEYRGKPSNILVAIGFGSAMGLSYADSLYRINVIQGKPTMSAELIASQVRKAGHRLRTYKDEKNQSVKAVIIRKDDPDFEFSEVRDKDWAEQMGLASKDNYRKQPMTMLKWRAITAVAREACPEALYGVAYSPDELEDMPKVDDVRQTDTVEDASVVDPAPSGEQPVQAVVMSTKDQQERIADLMRQAGVHTTAQAQVAFKALTGKDLSLPDQLTHDNAAMLLDAPDMVVSRTREALQGKAGGPDAEAGGAR